MVRYRRNRVPGATYFFTVTLRDRNSDLLVRHVGELRTAWRRAHERYPHQVVAAVVLPEHLHAVITMAEGGCDYARSEEHTSELQSRENLVCRLLLEKKNQTK